MNFDGASKRRKEASREENNITSDEQRRCHAVYYETRSGDYDDADAWMTSAKNIHGQKMMAMPSAGARAI